MEIPKQPWLSPTVELRESAIDRVGLFAIEPIEEGELVLVWGGAYMDGEAASRSGQPSMQWDEDLFSIDDGSDHPSFRINHACEPNVWMIDAFRLVASRPIAAGEELLADYAFWIADPAYVAPWVCRCGSPRCRQRITGRDWEDPDLQERYRGHFSPLLNRRIEAPPSPAPG